MSSKPRCNTNQKADCTFCAIALGEDDKTELLYQDADTVAFRDITPSCTHHYLIIPKCHIQDGRFLTAEDIGLVQRLTEVGLKVLKERGGDLTDVRLGYHWPPFNSVYHLHLHVISPVTEMSFISRLIFRPNSRWFVTPENVIARLERLQRASL